MLTVASLSSCKSETEDPLCMEGYTYNDETNQCDEDVSEITFDNEIALNTMNENGWQSNFSHLNNTTFSVEDGLIRFIQNDKSETDQSSDKTISYESLDFDEGYVYTVSFQVFGPADNQVDMIFEYDDHQFVNESYFLDGSEQSFSLQINHPDTTSSRGILKIQLGLINNGDEIMIYDIDIKKELRSEAVVNVLFVGNSFTYYNDMPLTFQKLGLANGFASLHVEDVTFGGTTLEKFATPGTEESLAFVSKINERHWDYVILQDHSSRPYTNKTSFINAVSDLTTYIEGKESIVILYSTWAYRDNSDKLASTGLSYDDFYQRLTDGYREAASLNNIDVVPVGTIFYQLYTDHPEINLLSTTDDFHPNASGSFVAAYAFYTFIFGQSNNDYIPNDVSSDLVDTLKAYVLMTIHE